MHLSQRITSSCRTLSTTSSSWAICSSSRCSTYPRHWKRKCTPLAFVGKPHGELRSARGFWCPDDILWVRWKSSHPSDIIRESAHHSLSEHLAFRFRTTQTIPQAHSSLFEFVSSWNQGFLLHFKLCGINIWKLYIFLGGIPESKVNLPPHLPWTYTQTLLTQGMQVPKLIGHACAK